MKIYNHLLIYKGTYYSVYFHADKPKESSVYEYYKKCDYQTRANFLYLVKRLSDHGRIYDTSKFRIEDRINKIYAFKPKKERFFCFFENDKIIIVTSAYQKTRQKLDKNEVKKACKIRDLYFKGGK